MTQSVTLGLTFSLLLPFWPLSVALCPVVKIEAQTVARRHRVPLISLFISLGHLDRRRTLLADSCDRFLDLEPAGLLSFRRGEQIYSN